MDIVLSLNDDELKNEDKKTISDISQLLENLLRNIYPKETSEIIEKFNLEIAYKCFLSKSLEKRLSGLSDIHDYLIACWNKQHPNRTGPSIEHNTLWMDSL